MELSKLLLAQWSRSCDRLLARLEGLTDDEYRWEPVPGWNVRPSPASPSGWTVDYPAEPPLDSPFTTIAWRLLHISDGNVMYWDHSFGNGTKQFTDLIPHGDAGGAIEYLMESQRPVTETLAGITDEELAQPRMTHFGTEWPGTAVISTLLDEQVHHGAEVALLRDLYRVKDALRRHQ